MRRHGLLFRLSALTFALASASAWAINCNVTTNGFTAAYAPTVATANDSTGSLTIACTRTLAEVNNWEFRLRANNGQNSIAPPQNRAQRGATANHFNYELYTNFAGGTAWASTNATQIGYLPLSFATGSTFVSVTVPFFARIPGSQVAGTAGTYTDFVTITPRVRRTITPRNNTDPPTVQLPVTIITTSYCQFTSPAGTINLNYIALQNTASTASTNFSVRCINGETYSIALSAPISVLLGLNYSLAISTNPGGVAVPSSTTGTGLTGNGIPQSYNITGTIAAGQAGTCPAGSCNATQIQNLTITY
jgi:spore coat protein U-like protein